MTNWIQKYGAILIILISFLSVSIRSFADVEPPTFGDEYQTELPAPPAFPLNFKNINADNEESKSEKDEDRERFDPEKTQIGERILQDAKWSTDYEIDFSDWERSDDDNDWNIDGEMVVLVILGSLGTILIIFLVLFFSKMTFKRKRKNETEGTESIIAHLESVTKNQTHEKLAINGDFDIAVHALLLDVLRVIFRADPDMDRPSVTAREIRASYEQPEIEIDLGPLIQVVEWSRFAERPATEEDYFNLVPKCERLIAIFQERVWRNKATTEDRLL